MSDQPPSGTQHRIKDENCEVVVISDLHKYSGVSNFSKGENPFFDAYWQLYDEGKIGPIPKHVEAQDGYPAGADKLPYQLTEKEERQIELAVKKHCPRQAIEAKITELWPDEKKREKRQKRADPMGTWKRRQEIFESFGKAKYVVLNGDIFDIECSKNPKRKISEGVEWLKARMDEAPDTEFHFVLGNHEAFRKFIGAMQELENDPHYSRQFKFHEHYFQLNDSLFVHGDEYLGVAKYVKAYKQVKKGEEKRNDDDEIKIPVKSNEGKRVRSIKELKEIRPLSRKAYEMFNGLYHRSGNAWKGMYRIVSTLYDKIGNSDTEGLKDAFLESNHIFSGHTHQPYGAHFKDKYFWNTGAAIQSLHAGFRPLRIHMEKGVTKHVEPLLQKDREIHPQRPYVSLKDSEAKKYFVISDLHMFGRGVSRYDQEPELRDAIDKAMSNADVIVLNGDIFELFFAKKDINTTMAEAIKWLREVIDKNPGKEIHYVLGNHEGVKEFITEVQKLQTEIEGLNTNSKQFYFWEHAFRPHEKTVFIHGDEIMGGTFEGRHIYDLQNGHSEFMRQFANHKLEWFAMKAVKWARYPEKVARRIFQSLADVPNVDSDKIENLFIGHTHVPFVDEPSKGKWATNTGSTTNYGSFAGVSFEMAPDGTITTPHIVPHSVDTGVISSVAF